jgi:mannose-6-phosphate isomerase-like protein (cupin superfamily)
MTLVSGQANSPEQKKQWANSDDIPWSAAGVNGPGTSIKMLLIKDNGMIDDIVKGMWLMKVDPKGEFTVTATAKEERAFFVAGGQGLFTLGDQQIETKPGDAFAVPAGVKHGLKNSGNEPVELVVLSSNLQAPKPEAKPAWGRADDMEWQPNNTHGPGCSTRNLLGRESGIVFRMWLMKVDPGGLNYVHSDAEHQLFYIWKAPVPGTTDARTHAARWIVKDKIMQTKAGDAFYLAGPPNMEKHGSINESRDTPMIYLGIGVAVPRQQAAGRGRGSN